MTTPITASQLDSHLTCSHRVTMDAFADPDTKDPVSPFVQLLWERGTTFESEVVAGLEDPFTDLSQLRGQEKEGAMRAAIAAGDRLIYSGRLSLDDLLGEPDILRREGPGYVAIDIKSGAGKEGSDEGTDDYGKPKKHYGVQIALYTDILVRLGISAGRYGFIWDIHRQEKRYDLDTPLGPKSPCLWEIYLEVTAVVASALLAPGTTQPAAASACKLCVWRSNCLSELKTGQDLTLLPELGRSRRDTLVAQFPTLPDLAHADVERFMKPKNKTDFPGIGADMLRKYRARAVLAIADNPVPYLTKSIAWPTAPAELFFDIETDSMRNLCYLHGFVIREGSKTRGERFEAIYVADLTKNAERVAFAAAMAIFRRYSEAVIVHYSKYERTEYRKLVNKYPDIATPEEIEALFSRPRALDLYYDVVKPASELPTMDFSIKSVAKVSGFKWRDSDPSGASSIEWFDQWAKSGKATFKQRLLDYEEDDCRAIRVVTDYMKELDV